MIGDLLTRLTDGGGGGSDLLAAEWRHLAMVSWRVPRALLAARVPRGVELDEWEGSPWLSLVALRFLGLTVAGVPVPMHQDFAQVNLRFYVRRTVDGEVRHGATFVRELVPRAAIVAAARLAINEPMMEATTTHRIDVDERALGRATFVEYTWDTKPGRGRLALTPTTEPRLPEPLSLEEFIAERCWGYTPQRDGGTTEYRVTHPRWSVFSASNVELTGDFIATFDADLAPILSRPPDSAFVAEGSRVTLGLPRRIGG